MVTVTLSLLYNRLQAIRSKEALANFRLNRPLAESRITVYEKRHRFTIPSDYCDFLTGIGNGGLSPLGKLFRLGEIAEPWGLGSWSQNDGIVGSLTRDFPHNAAWNDRSSKPTQPQDERLWEEFQRYYWSSDHVSGAIPIAYHGPAERYWLVVQGPERGTVWRDGRAAEEGIVPVRYLDKERATFSEWYYVCLQRIEQCLLNAVSPRQPRLGLSV